MAAALVAYVYAVPLVRLDGRDAKPMAALDTVTERHRLKEVLQRSRCRIQWLETVATPQTFWRVRVRS